MLHMRTMHHLPLATKGTNVGLNPVGKTLLTVHGRHLALIVLRSAQQRGHVVAVAVRVANILKGTMPKR